MEIGCEMKTFEFLRRIYFKTVFYCQKFQKMIMSIVVIGIFDYFFLYELLVSLTPLMPLLTLEVAPVFIIILSIIMIRGIYKFIRKKLKENKHLLLL